MAKPVEIQSTDSVRGQESFSHTPIPCNIVFFSERFLKIMSTFLQATKVIEKMTDKFSKLKRESAIGNVKMKIFKFFEKNLCTVQ